MAGTFAETTVFGRLGQDAEVKYSGNGAIFLTMSVATDKWVPNDDPKTVWYNVIAFGRLAETMATLMDNGALSAGDQVFVKGVVDINTYTKNDGVTGANLSLEANNITLASARNAGQSQTQAPRQAGQAAPRPLPARR